MDIFEFELRWRAFSWLLTFFGEEWTSEQLLSYIQRTPNGELKTELVETSIEQLRTATRASYTTVKQQRVEAAYKEEFKWKTKGEYIERLEYELKVIFEMWYNTYFLVVRDYIYRAKSQQIMVWPGRWSVAGSLLSYVLGITDLDPLEYDLIFERFLNPGRISMPDIDTDFEDTYRDRVIDYITNRYGHQNVSHIGTYMTLAARASFKDVARVMGIKFDQANKLSALISEKTITDSKARNKDLQNALQQDTRLERVIDTASALEGTVRQTGVHACGMIIAPSAVTNYSPIQYPPKIGSKWSRDEERIVSQYEGPVIEDLGLLKMDILWLRNLSIIKHTAKILQARAKTEGKELPILIHNILEKMSFHPPLGDTEAYAIFAAGDTSGVFQFESDGMRGWLKKLKPNTFDDLIAMVSLYRPWPMEFIPHYIDRKYGIEEVSYMPSELYQILSNHYGEDIAKQERDKLVQDLDPFMRITYGIAVYQEQLMRLVQAMAGFSMAEADNVRKGIGKKIREVIEKTKIEFVKRAQSYKDYKSETAHRVYEKMIEPAADYSFNKSHAACYAYISYQTARLKAHYPLEFHAALLRSVEQDPNKLAQFIQEVQLQGVVVRPPNINTSFEHVSAIDDHLELGFVAIKGIGSEVGQYIEQERTVNWSYESLGDFLRRIKEYTNKKTLESLVKAGALDVFGDRNHLLDSIPEMLERSRQQQLGDSSGWLFGEALFDGQEFALPPSKKNSSTDVLMQLRTEKEVFNVGLSFHPLDGLYARCRTKYNFITAVNIENFGEFHLCAMVVSLNKGMRGGYFLQIEDITGQMELYLQEKIDVEPFDILYITGYKGMRMPKIDTIRVLSLKSLRAKAQKAKLYTPNQTVAEIRQLRKQEYQASLPSSFVPTDTSEETAPKQVSSDLSPKNSSTAFPAPENIAILAQLPQLLKAYPGEVAVTIGDLQATISDEWVQKLQQLLG